MDPLITNGIDPALLRVLEKRGHDRDRLPGASGRRIPGHPEKKKMSQPSLRTTLRTTTIRTI
jgi:hypothetical protein